MAYWLVLHSLKSFSEHNDMIGIVSATGRPEPMYRPFSKIKKFDRIAYYAIRDSVIVGLFKVISDMEYSDDEAWGPSCIYHVTPEILPPSGKVLDFTDLANDTKLKLDLFPARRNWQTYLRGHACRPLSERDYGLIRRRLVSGPGLVDTPIVRPP